MKTDVVLLRKFSEADDVILASIREIDGRTDNLTRKQFMNLNDGTWMYGVTIMVLALLKENSISWWAK